MTIKSPLDDGSMKYRNLFILLICMHLSQLGGKVPIPFAPIKPELREIHGITITDNWSYLRNREDKDLHKLLKQEERYTKAMMKPAKPLADSLYREFIAAADINNTSHPYEEGGYLYYTRSTKGKAYPLHYRRKDTPNSTEECILDENHLARGKAYYALDIYSVSPDQHYLAYSLDSSGDEVYSLFIKDLCKGSTFQTSLEGITDFKWCSNSKNYLYVAMDERWRSAYCYLGDRDSGERKLKFNEQDAAYDLSLYKSCDKSLIFLLCSSKDETEVYYLSSSQPDMDFTVISERKEGISYYPDYLDETFYIQTDIRNPDQEIVRCYMDDLGTEAWDNLVPGKDGEPISSFLLFKNYLVLLKRVNGFEAFEIYALPSGQLIQHWQPPVPSDLDFWYNNDPAASSFTYSLENYLEPYGIYEYNFTTGEHKCVYRSPVSPGYDKAKYHSELHFVPAADGSLIPLSLVYKGDLDTTRTHPVWLYGYGAYGDCEDPYFSQSRFPLLDRDVIYAVANIRGGGEKGDAWYRQGKLLNKMNSFTDFITCMDYLNGKGICSPSQMLIEGGSAGGLLVGTVANMAYNKCRMVIADVPFVDLISTMLDESLPLTVQEYEEWGDPHDPEYFRYMLKYSPYDNVSTNPYPAFLISTAWMDTRVGYWEGLKWAQQLRTKSTSGEPILFRMNWHEGHTGVNDIYQSLRYYADTCAYGIFQLRGN